MYVSPLKALGTIFREIWKFRLAKSCRWPRRAGCYMPEIRTAVRTGDTLAHERRTMLVHPPHILVTTPESLYILLTAEKSREILNRRDGIVDEIHAVADDKRGAHLALSLERLEALTERPPLRIGLSATQKPDRVVAQFLTGNGRPEPAIVQIGHSGRSISPSKCRRASWGRSRRTKCGTRFTTASRSWSGSTARRWSL